MIAWDRRGWYTDIGSISVYLDWPPHRLLKRGLTGNDCNDAVPLTEFHDILGHLNDLLLSLLIISFPLLTLSN